MKIKFFFWENWKKLFLPEMANFSAFNWHGNKFPTLPKLSEKSKNYYLIKMVSKWKRPLKKGLVLIFDFWYFKLLMPINLALDYSPGNLTHLFQVYGHGTKLKIIVKILLKCPLPPSSLYCKVPEPKSPRSCKIAIEYVKFWFWPINVWPHPVSCQKKSTDRAKSNPVFFSGRRRGDRMRWVWLSVSLVQSDCRARLRWTNVSWQVLKFAVFKKLFCVQTLKLTEITFFSDFKF